MAADDARHGSYSRFRKWAAGRGGMSMFERKRSAKDFADEIKAHLELEADELRSEGSSDEEARRKARLEFGNVTAAQERFNVKGRWVRLEKVLRDVRFALRSLRQSPG